MSTELVVLNVVMLLVASAVGSAYVYLQREAAPYAPRMRDYLGDRRA